MNAAATELAAALARLRAQLEGNPRLAAMMLLVPLLLVMYLALLARDAIDTARSDRAPLARREARLDALAASGEWGTRIREQEQELARLEQRVWRAGSAELAAADLQTVLRGIIGQRLAWNRLKLAPPEELRGLGGWRIEAEINGKLREEGVLPLLQDLSEHRPRLLLEQMQVSSQRGQTVTLQLSVLVLPEKTP